MIVSMVKPPEVVLNIIEVEAASGEGVVVELEHSIPLGIVQHANYVESMCTLLWIFGIVMMRTLY